MESEPGEGSKILWAYNRRGIMSEIHIKIKYENCIWTAENDDINLSETASTRSELMSCVFEKLSWLYGSYPDVDPSKYPENQLKLKRILVNMGSIVFIGDV